MTRRGVIAFLLCCVAVGGAFYALLEPRSEVVKGDFRGDALRNPYLGVVRMLEAMDLPVTVKRDMDQLAELPPADATLLLLGRRTYLSAQQSGELRDWVARGGHLIVRAFRGWDGLRPDPLLDALGVRLRRVVTEREEDDDGSALLEPGISLARWSPEPGVVMRIDFDGRFALEIDEKSDPVEVWSDDTGDHGYSIALGAGHVTVWSDDRFLRNDGIGRFDHAQLAYRLVKMFGASGKTWVVIGDIVRRSLLARILEDAWSVCIALGLWVVGYLWSIAPRFGPVLPDPPAERRELMEHVRASGTFLLRSGGFDTLVSAVRSALARRIQQRHPQWLLLGARARVERVAEHTGLAPAEIEDALESASPTQRNTLVKRIATLEAIRKRL